MEKLLRWQERVSRAVTQGVVKGSSVTEITEGGPAFEDDEVTGALEVVSEPRATNEWGVGYINGVPVLYALDGPEGPEAYPVPEGFIHEQVYQGYAWEVERAEIVWGREERPGWDRTGTIAESWTMILQQDAPPQSSGEDKCRGYACRVDRFTDGGYAYSISHLESGTYLRGAENEAAESFEDAERAVVARIMEELV